jgi:hypothetical protein
MAMTAWSAKVWSNRICFSENGRTSVRRRTIVPSATPSRIRGTPSTVREPIRCAALSENSSASVFMSRIWTILASRTDRPLTILRPRGRVNPPTGPGAGIEP